MVLNRYKLTIKTKRRGRKGWAARSRENNLELRRSRMGILLSLWLSPLSSFSTPKQNNKLQCYADSCFPSFLPNLRCQAISFSLVSRMFREYAQVRHLMTKLRRPSIPRECFLPRILFVVVVHLRSQPVSNHSLNPQQHVQNSPYNSASPNSPSPTSAPSSRTPPSQSDGRTETAETSPRPCVPPP